jgi:hypothetical protein
MKLYRFRAVPLPIIRSSFTVHSAIVYAIQVWRQLSSRTILVLLESLYHCRVYSEWTPDDGQRNCSKHVEFHANIHLWNLRIWLVLLQRNLLRCTVTCHDVRSHERKILCKVFAVTYLNKPETALEHIRCTKLQGGWLWYWSLSGDCKIEGKISRK